MSRGPRAGRTFPDIKSPGRTNGSTTAKERNPYQVEHDDLFHAIRNDLPYNESEYGAHSTLTAIMGRMATYSGKEIDWDKALNSKSASRRTSIPGTRNRNRRSGRMAYTRCRSPEIPGGPGRLFKHLMC